MSIFFDDILVFSCSWEEHEEHLRCVLGILSQHQLHANHKKCSFRQEEVEYLGHVISRHGVTAHQ